MNLESKMALKAKFFLSKTTLSSKNLAEFCIQESESLLSRSHGPADKRNKSIKLYLQVLKTMKNEQLLEFLFKFHPTVLRQIKSKSVSTKEILKNFPRSVVFNLLNKKLRV